MTKPTFSVRIAITAAIALVCYQFGFAYAASNKAKDAEGLKPLWSEASTEINSVGFTPNGKNILFVKKAHEPDGEEAESLPEAVVKATDEKSTTDPRWADPEVMSFSLSTNVAEKIDYGWEPEGTSDGTKIFYIHQKKPISGHRVLAETQEGNELCVYNTGTKNHAIVVSPDKGYLGNPTISPNGERVAFALCDATNGAYGGQVGIGIFDVSNGLTTTVLPPAKHNDLPDLVSSMFWIGDQLFAIRETPLKAGMYRSDAYKVELLNVTSELKPIFESAKTDSSINFRAYPNQDGTITVIDEKRAIIDKTGRVIAKDLPIIVNEQFSPNRLINVRQEKDRIDIVRASNNKVITKIANLEPPPGCLAPQLSFSADSAQMAVVMDKSKTVNGAPVFDRSELFIMDLREK